PPDRAQHVADQGELVDRGPGQDHRLEEVVEGGGQEHQPSPDLACLGRGHSPGSRLKSVMVRSRPSSTMERTASPPRATIGGSAFAAAPESFMKVCGLARTSSPPPAATRAVSDFAARSLSWTWRRAASSSTTRKPRLWRVEAYSAPGLPSPMTSHRFSTGSIG